jgi:hypothetical protein
LWYNSGASAGCADADAGAAQTPAGPTTATAAPTMLNPKAQAITLGLISTRGISSRFRAT